MNRELNMYTFMQS